MCLASLLMACATWHSPSNPDGPVDHRKQYATQGAWHACYLDNGGKPHCWGHADEGRSTAPPTLRFKSLMSSHSFTCGIDKEDALQCWGNPPDFRIHKGISMAAAHVHQICSIAKDTQAVQCSTRFGGGAPPAGFKATYIDGEDGGMCAVGVNGSVACWGKAPKPSRDIKTAVRVALSASHGCALLNDGTLRCWGGDSTVYPSRTEKALDFAVARNSTCIIQENHQARCWGKYAKGYAPLESGVAIYGNYDVHCMLTTTGSFECWGAEFGNLTSGAPGTKVVKGF